MKKQHQLLLMGTGFLGPALLIIALIALYPMIYAVYVSVHETTYLQIGEFIGIDNYVQVFRSSAFMNSLKVSVIYVFSSLAIVVPFSLLVSLLLNQRRKYTNVFRVIILVPWVFSQVTAGMLWAWLLNGSYGIVNFVISTFGIQRVDFFSNVSLALPTLIAINAWWSYPLPTLFFLAALQNIPEELYESATLDGASNVDCFWHITMPFLVNTLLVVLIIQTMLYFNMVTLIYVLTGGGPLGATETLSFKIFFDTLFNMKIGTASSMSVVLFIINLLFAGLYGLSLKQEAIY